MKNNLILLLFFFLNTAIFAQDNTSGIITYEQVIDYDLGDYKSDPAREAYVSDLPKQGKSKFVLSFSGQQAFYEQDLENVEAQSQKLQNAIAKGSYGKAPTTKTKQVYFNMADNSQIEQVEFMTRNFNLKSGLPQLAWKITSDRKKVLDYVCIGAELTQGKQTFKAWFSLEIPISAGPADYYGLPGLILAVEKNSEVFLLATKVDLGTAPSNLKAMLNEGKEMNKAEFDKTVAEKEQEYKESMRNKKGYFKKGD